MEKKVKLDEGYRIWWIIFGILALVLVLTFAFGCAGGPLTKREIGAGVGVAGGAAAGAIIGNQVGKGHSGAGAGIGGFLGGIFGWIIGDQLQGQEKSQEELQRQIGEQGRELEKQKQELERLRNEKEKSAAICYHSEEDGCGGLQKEKNQENKLAFIGPQNPTYPIPPICSC